MNKIKKVLILTLTIAVVISLSNINIKALNKNIEIKNELKNLDESAKILEIFPDISLARKIAEILNTDVEALVTQEDLNNINYILLGDITNLEGVQHLNNLIELGLYGSRIGSQSTSILIEPIKNLKNLKRITIGKYSNIPDINLISNLTQLEYLSINNTKFPNFDFLAPLVNLDFLNISNSNITDGSSLQNLTKLKNLSLISNQGLIDGSKLGNLTNLVYLSIYGADFLNFDFLIPLVNLKDLAISNSKTTDLSPLENLTELTKLSLSFLNDTEILDASKLSNLTKLEELNLYTVSFLNFDFLAPLINLSNLNVSNTNIEDLTSLNNLTEIQMLFLRNNEKMIDGSQLANLTKLKYLNIDDSNVKDISFVSNLSELTDIYARNNGISDISPIENLTNLIWIEFNNNEITTLSSLENLVNLEVIQIENNNISDLTPILNLLKLKTLNVTNNNITDFELVGNIKTLTSISLEGNYLESLALFSDMPNLRDLRLSGENIKEISNLVNVPNLYLLHLENTAISEFDLRNYKNLKYFSLVNNPLTEINLENIGDISTIFLSNNETNNIKFPKDNTSLRTVILENNNISTLPGIEGLKELIFLNANKNRITDLSQFANVGRLAYIEVLDQKVILDEEYNKGTFSLKNEIKNLDGTLLKPNELISNFSSLPISTIEDDMMTWTQIKGSGEIGYKILHMDFNNKPNIYYSATVTKALSLNYIDAEDFKVNINDVNTLTSDKIIEKAKAIAYKNSKINLIDFKIVENNIENNRGTYGVKFETISGEIVNKKINVKVLENYKIDFNTNGGTSVASITAEEESDLNINQSTIKEGYTFLGWFDKGDKKVTNIKIAENITLSAKWEENIKVGKITFNTNGGTIVNDINANFGTKITINQETSKKGYTFLGWYDETDTLINTELVISKENHILNAKWFLNPENKIGTIKFNTDGGTAVSDVTGNIGSIVIIDQITSKSGYIFLRWENENGELVSSNMLISKENHKLTAKWRKISGDPAPIEHIKANNFTLTVKEIQELQSKKTLDYFSKALVLKANAGAWLEFNGVISNLEITEVQHNILAVAGEYNVTFSAGKGSKITIVLTVDKAIETVKPEVKPEIKPEVNSNLSSNKIVSKLENTGIENNLIRLYLVLGMFILILCVRVKINYKRHIKN